ncbi:single-stranded-DNA-specific exonuclease RecJ [Patescibacteria group bacterium]|nr:single-stranded-DNA-specific exonuclease RecJ [Patescibacteria group bacterium]MCL5091618.1 single-stranded-DNA-specific exonuclease RecJ [Patescibacteria group bacterium]
MKINWRAEIKETDNPTTKTITDLIITRRKITDLQAFLHPPAPDTICLTDFRRGYQKKMAVVIKLLQEIKENRRTVVVYTDYDADGLTGGAILWETLHLLGFKAMPYVPHRKKEGYGFSVNAIDTIKRRFDPALIISVDHGITAKEKVSYAKKLGIPIVITDHHLAPKQLPDDALAIFHIPALSGAGVAYFFAKEIFNHFSSSTDNQSLIADNFNTDYLALAATGIVADMVPLIGPARSLVKYGLLAYPQVKRPGLRQILRQAGIGDKPVTPYEIGFIIAPRINAVGRLEHAIDALRLLCTHDAQRAHRLTAHLNEKNADRQAMVTKAVEEAKQLVIRDSQLVNLPEIIILRSEKWHEGIIGLIASKICETYFRPTIVITKSDGHYKGSARSIPALHITDFLRELKQYLVDVGGHKQAAGFTIDEKQLTDFVKAAEKKAGQMLKANDLEPVIEVDMKLPLKLVTLQLFNSLTQFEPFGIGNPRPTFYSEVELVDAKVFGKTNAHLKLLVKDPHSRAKPMEMIAFKQANKFNQLARNEVIKLIYSVETNQWMNKQTLRGVATIY